MNIRMHHLTTHLLIYALYGLVALLITWPLATQLTTHLAGYPFGDAHEMTRHIWWIKYALQTGQPLIDQPLLGYPAGMSGVILWSNPLQFFPAWLLAFVLPLPAAYNTFVLLTLALNGWAAYWFLHRLTGQPIAAFLAGLAFMAAPTLQGHLAGGHGGLLVQWPLPILAYHSMALTGLLPPPAAPRTSRRQILLTAAFIFITPLGHTLQLIYAVLPLLAVIGLTCLIRRDGRALLRLIAAALIGLTLLIIFLLPVFSATFGTSAYTDEGGGVDFSADLLGIITPSFNHPLYGQWQYTHRVLGINIVEGSSYVGLVAALIALLALWRVKAARWWLGLAVLAWIASLGPLLKLYDTPITAIIGGYPTAITLPWALISDLPGFSLARTPGRFNFLLALAVAVWVGLGVAYGLSRWHIRRPALRYLLAATLAALILLDYQSFWPLPTTDARIPSAVANLAQDSTIRAVYNLPWDNLLAAKDALWLQTAHRQPMIAGQVTRRTPVSPAKLNLLQNTLDPLLLDQAGVDVLIIHKHYDTGSHLLNAARAAFAQPAYEDENLALFRLPPLTSAAPPALHSFQPPAASPNRSTLNLYAPAAGWLNLTFNHAGAAPAFRLSLDGQSLREWPAAAFTGHMSVALPIPAAGYYVITADQLPPCPELRATPLVCPQSAPAITTGTTLIPDLLDQPIDWERGVHLLAAAHTPPIPAQPLTLNLWWRFDQPITEQDIRFIKIVDGQGTVIAEDDRSLGAHPPAAGWLDSLTLQLPPDLPAGTYSIYAGWYTYPDLTRFPLRSSPPGAADSWARLAQFTLPLVP